MVAKLIQRHKNVFNFFQPFHPRLNAKFVKSRQKYDKTFFVKIAIWSSKDAAFDADFKSVTPVAKKSCEQS
jgi:hypothetical protein